MKCPKCGTEWKNESSPAEIAIMCVISVCLFPIGLFSLFILKNKKYCRTCHYNMEQYVQEKYNSKNSKKSLKRGK